MSLSIEWGTINIVTNMPSSESSIDGFGGYNTEPDQYVLAVTDIILRVPVAPGSTPSHRMVDALRATDSRVQKYGFRAAVLDAIFDDAVDQNYEDESKALRLRQRLERRFGRRRARKMLISRVEVLESWKNRDGNFVPDAFLIDDENRTVVCYEIEDTHPLNVSSIRAYANAWYTLEYIFWDLHLIAYDIFGHHKIITLPTAELIAINLRAPKS